MSRIYAPKKIDLTYEEVKLPEEEYQQRLADAFDILFEETLKFVKENGSKDLLNQKN